MSFLNTINQSPVEKRQGRLLLLATLFLFIYSIILTLAPAVRMHSWDVEYRWNHWIGFGVWFVGVLIVHDQLRRWLPERDPLLFPIWAMLTGWGLLTIWRLDDTMGLRQTIWAAICLVVFAVGLQFSNPLGLLRRYKYVWLTAGLLLTGLTFFLGVYPGGDGPRLWLGCCGMYLQPSEPLKLLLIAFMAAYLADHLPITFNLAELLAPTLIVVGISLGLLIAQRDLGTASLFILIYAVIVYMASGRWRILLISLLILLGAGILGYLLFDVVRIRVDAWLNPWLDPAGRSYQIIQSLLSTASGGIFGRGPGIGNPGVVPVAHSDFIFSAITEETGVLGGAAMVGIYLLLVERGFRAALFASNYYRRYLAAGLTTYITAQAVIIMGGNLRLLPLTGMTLPFVSYGGSSLLTATLSMLILILISSPGEEEPAPLPKPIPYLVTASGLGGVLITVALITGWWGFVRSDRLVTRPENPRTAIADRYVPRGNILDRNNHALTQTVGQPGDLRRDYLYPLLSNTLGYISATYGRAGLEAGLNDYLRGLRGNPASLIWSEGLLYGQPPTGLDIRLTLDLEMQKKADALLQGHPGAVVMLNAQSGEILGLSSQPSFDANQIDSAWTSLLQDPNSPLLNRATQGAYPPGTALGPFLLAIENREGKLPEAPDTLSYQTNAYTLNCADTTLKSPSIIQAVAGGCPAASIALGKNLNADALTNLFDSLGFYEQPNIPLETATTAPRSISKMDLASIGQDRLTITPLQMAVAAAALSNEGVRPGPQLARAVQTPQEGWLILPQNEAKPTALTTTAAQTAQSLAYQGQNYWQVIALARSNQKELTWYIGGTLPGWSRTPIAVAVLLEENNPQLAQEIGQSLFGNTPAAE